MTWAAIWAAPFIVAACLVAALCLLEAKQRMDRRLPLSRHPFEVCPACGSHEPIRVGLAIQCSECGEFLRPLEAA